MEAEPVDKTHVIRANEVIWSEASRNPEESDPAGEEFTAFERGPFSTGLWQRDVQRRRFERPYSEIAYIIEGEVELTLDDGSSLRAGPGDILITPKGATGFWQNLSPVRKFWAIYEG
jgi:uncharacterized cupin superfamily protein